MINSLQGIIVAVITKTNIQSKILKTTIMILCSGTSWIEVAIDKLH